MAKKTDTKDKPLVTDGEILDATPTRPPSVLANTNIGNTLEADVSDEIFSIAPTFGDVLLSIGSGVAASQTALDQGVIQSARELSTKKIKVVTDVIQELDDDGLPNAESTQLIEKEVSVLNYVKPSVHEWSHVALQMDLSIGEIDKDKGFRFNKKQTSGGITGVGLLWGFAGFGVHSQRERTTYRSSSSESETDWAKGQVRMDAMLRPRDVQALGAPLGISVGPQIFVSPSNSQEIENSGVVVERTVDLDVTILKASGEANSGITVEIDPGSFQLILGPDGAQTDTEGKLKITLKRAIPNVFYSRPLKRAVTITLGQIERSIDVVL